MSRIGSRKQENKISSMKKSVILLIAFVFINASYAQSYIPLLQNGNKWNVVQNVGGSGIFYTEIFKVGNDSAYIQNKWWKKIYITTDSSANATYTFKTYLREESNGKVYILDTLMQARLYFDFSAHAGDTLVLYNTYEILMDTFVVSQVDMEVYGGLNRKKISMRFFNNQVDKWYEGIGSSRGIIYGNARPNANSDLFLLNCFSQYEQLIYHQPYFPYFPCYIHDVGISDFNETQFSIFPNPVTNAITFNTGMKQDFNLIIFNSIGQTVLQKRITVSNTTLNIHSFKQGVYYYQLINEKGKMISGKFVKE
ncbi:MAG: T9SS type A sorting domain-containing protein [Bacteroidales bacterium]